MDISPIRDWQGKKIMIIGDIMIDRYFYGDINRISPEAPVPIVDLNQQYDRLGGAANVGLNIKALGGTPFIFGVVGADEDAKVLLSLHQQSNLSNHYIIQDKQRITTVKTRVWASNKQILRIDREIKNNLSIEKEELLWKSIQETITLQSIDAIVLQDYNKGVLSAYNIPKIIQIATQHQIPVIVDPKLKNFFSYKGATVFKPNLKEINAQLDHPISANNIAELKMASNFLRQQLGHKISMFTLSEYGVFLDNQQQSLISPTQKRTIIDVCGAGDTVLSIAALAVTTETSLENIGILANLAGGQVCESIGVSPVSLKKLEAEYFAIKKSAH